MAAPLEVREVGDGAYIVPNVRGGFAPMVAEFGDFVVAVEQDLEGLEWEAVG